MDAVDQVRAFNRVVTQRMGVLEDRYLARGRPLGASRVLWEIGADGADVRALRIRLDLDSGYLSRLLRRLEAEGLLTVTPDDADRRVRRARLTAAGRAELAELDRLSDDLAGAVLTALDEPQQERLVEAMATVQRLLTASAVTISPADPAGADVLACMRAYVEELDRRFEGGFDASRSPWPARDLVPPRGLVLLAVLHGEPVGCAAVRFGAPGEGTVKRLWVSPAARGFGLGRRLMRELESAARPYGVAVLKLETNRALTEAIALYRSSGYVEVPRFSDEPHAHHWFVKRLDG